MTDLVEYLRARIAEDKAAATAATPGPWRYDSSAAARSGRLVPGAEEFVVAGPRGDAVGVATTGSSEYRQSMMDAAHIARWDPARVLAECAAKRAIIDRHDRLTGAGGVYRDGVPCQMCWPARCELHLFAQPYAGRDDFNPAWRMEAGRE